MSRKSAASRELPTLPQRRWGELFGHEKTKRDLHALFSQERSPQVLMLEGRDGIGKRALLAYLCGLIYCATRDACGHCDGCRDVQSSYQGDLLWIETEGAIKVAEADQVQEHLTYRAGSEAATRVVVMPDIESLTEQAANRLLKTLEEPPPNVRILLSCSRPRQLLPTIASRLVRWHVEPPPIAESLNWLSTRLPERSRTELEEQLLTQGLSPGRTFRVLEETKDHKEAIDRLRHLLLRPYQGSEMQDLLKQLGWKAPELAQQCEVLLNRTYRASLGLAGKAGKTPDLNQIRHWRRILRQIYRAGGRGHNQLNTQMAAEALGSC